MGGSRWAGGARVAWAPVLALGGGARHYHGHSIPGNESQCGRRCRWAGGARSVALGLRARTLVALPCTRRRRGSALSTLLSGGERAARAYTTNFFRHLIMAWSRLQP